MGVSPEASTDEIKKVYKKLARKYHPDVSKEADAQARFQEIGEAYDVLKDASKREEYDQYRAYVLSGGGAQTQFGGQFDFDDLINSIFGRSGMAQSGFRQDWRPASRHPTTISLTEAFSGCQRQLSMSGPDGQAKKINVTIPAGISSGKELRLKGQSPGGGDLFLEIHVADDARFRLDNRDVYLELPVAPWEAALGAEIQVPTPGGVVNLKLKENSKPGQKLRLKGRGLPAYASAPAGDQYVVLNIVNPRISTEAEREAYRKLAMTFNYDPRVQAA